MTNHVSHTTASIRVVTRDATICTCTCGDAATLHGLGATNQWIDQHCTQPTLQQHPPSSNPIGASPMNVTCSRCGKKCDGLGGITVGGVFQAMDSDCLDLWAISRANGVRRAWGKKVVTVNDLSTEPPR